MANIYGATSLTGGGAEALDSIDGAGLADGDVAMVVTTTETYHYTLDATSGAAENSPTIIAPDTNPGTKRWLLKQPESTTLQFPTNSATPHFNTVQRYFEHAGSALPIVGFGVTESSGEVIIDAGQALLRSTNNIHTSRLEEYDIPGGTTGSGLPALTDNSMNYIFADYNSGTPTLQVYTSIPTDGSQGMTKVPIWFISKDGTNLEMFDMREYAVDYAHTNAYKDFNVHGFQHAQGGSLIGFSNRNITLSSGRFFLTNVAKNHVAFDTSGADTFTYYYSDGGTGWTTVASQSQIDNEQYDGGSGSLVSLATNDYGCHWVFLILNTPPALIVVYGTKSHTTLADAQAEGVPSSLPPSISQGGVGVLVGKVIIRDGSTVITEVASPFLQTLTTATPTTHNGLDSIQGGITDEYYHITQDEYTTLPAKYISASTDPVANNDGVDTAALGIAFEVGDEWYRTDTSEQWCCTDNTTGAAVWDTMLIDPFTTDIRIVSNVSVGHKHTVHDYIRHVGSSIPIDGLDLTDNADGTVDITAGTAILRNTSDIHTSTFVEYDVAAVTNQALTDNTTNYVMVNYNAGSPQIQVYTSFPAGYGTTIIPIWFITRVGNDLHSIDMREVGLDHTGIVYKKDYSVHGFEHVPGGTILTETGTRQLSITAGTFYLASNEIAQSAFDTSAADTFTYIYDNGAGGWTRVASQTTISNTQYDDGDGTLGNVAAQDYGVHWVYIAFDETAGAHLYVMYGRESYNTLADAQAAELPSTDVAPEIAPGSNSVFIGKIIVLQGATNFAEIQSPFLQLLGSATPTTHNGLGGLQGGTTNEYYHLTSTQHGNIFAPAYGSMWINNNTTPEATLTTAGTYYKIAAFDNDGPSTANVTPDSTTDNDITITDAGDYEISVSLSFTGGNDETYHIAVFADGTRLGALTFERTMGTAATVGVGATSTIVTLAAADVIDLRVASDVSSDSSFAAHWGSLTVKRVA